MSLDLEVKDMVGLITIFTIGFVLIYFSFVSNFWPLLAGGIVTLIIAGLVTWRTFFD
jgi:hypothetical protein